MGILKSRASSLFYDILEERTREIFQVVKGTSVSVLQKKKVALVHVILEGEDQIRKKEQGNKDVLHSS